MLALLQSEHGGQEKMKTHSIILSNFSQEKCTLFNKIGRLETVLFSDCIKNIRYSKTFQGTLELCGLCELVICLTWSHRVKNRKIHILG